MASAHPIHYCPHQCKSHDFYNVILLYITDLEHYQHNHDIVHAYNTPRSKIIDLDNNETIIICYCQSNNNIIINVILLCIYEENNKKN